MLRLRAWKWCGACLCLLATLPSCSTYQFAFARDGADGWNLERLKADLAASESGRLIERTWIPLIYLDVTRFEKSPEDMPAGHRLFRGTAYGPLFFVGTDEDRSFDLNGHEVESWNRWGAAWGVVRQRTTRVQTPRGRRVETATDILFGVFGGIVTLYEPRADGTPALPDSMP